MKKTFYKLKVSDNLDEIGRYPQTVSFKGNYDKQASNSVYNIKWNKIPSFIPNVEEILLHESAIVTDIISFFTGGIYPFFSNKSTHILKQFRLPENLEINTKLWTENQKFDYTLFLFESDAINYLILDECTFAIKNSMTLEEEQTFQVSSVGELKSITSEAVINMKDVVSSNLVFDKRLNDFDLFNLDFLKGTHISESLGNELLRQNISGVELTLVSYQIEI